jgi:hypothetical protein
MSDTFDFGAATAPDGNVDAFHPSTVEVLPAGNYVVKISELENATSSGGYPMLKIVLDNEQGRQWDNLVISPNEFSVAKLLGLIDSAKLPRPTVETETIDPSNGRLADAYANLLIGKQVGVIVRDEEDNRPDHYGEFRPRVRGYVDPDVLSDATTGPLGGSTAASSPQGNGGRTESPLAF